MRAAHIFNVGKWVIDNDVFVVHWYVCRTFMGVCYQVFHVGKAWEQFSFKYQDEEKQLFPYRVPSESLKWSFRKVPLCD